jgi:hypothetical protein
LLDIMPGAPGGAPGADGLWPIGVGTGGATAAAGAGDAGTPGVTPGI